MMFYPPTLKWSVILTIYNTPIKQWYQMCSGSKRMRSDMQQVVISSDSLSLHLSLWSSSQLNKPVFVHEMRTISNIHVSSKHCSLWGKTGLSLLMGVTCFQSVLRTIAPFRGYKKYFLFCFVLVLWNIK